MNEAACSFWSHESRWLPSLVSMLSPVKNDNDDLPTVMKGYQSTVLLSASFEGSLKE